MLLHSRRTVGKIKDNTMSLNSFLGGMADGIPQGLAMANTIDATKKRRKDEEDQQAIRDLIQGVSKQLLVDTDGDGVGDTPVNSASQQTKPAQPQGLGAQINNPLTAPNPTQSPAVASNAGLTPPPVAAPQKPVADRVDPNELYSYLKGKGVSDTHALGMLANIRGESNFKPGAFNPRDANGGSRGLFQHNGVRLNAMRKAYGENPTWQQQVDFAMSEPETSTYLKRNFARPEDATAHWVTHWERPANPEQDIVKRNSFLRDLQGLVGKPAPTPQAATQVPNQTPQAATQVPNQAPVAAETPVTRNLNADKLADLYHTTRLKAMGNPYADKIEPHLKTIRDIGISMAMEPYQKLNKNTISGSLAYASALGESMAKFGETVDPSVYLQNAQVMSQEQRAVNQDQRLANQEQRLNNQEQRNISKEQRDVTQFGLNQAAHDQDMLVSRNTEARNQETHAATQDAKKQEYWANRVKLFDNAYTLLMSGDRAGAKSAFDQMGFTNLKPSTVTLPGGVNIPTLSFTYTDENGAEQSSDVVTAAFLRSQMKGMQKVLEGDAKESGAAKPPGGLDKFDMSKAELAADEYAKDMCPSDKNCDEETRAGYYNTSIRDQLSRYKEAQRSMGGLGLGGDDTQGMSSDEAGDTLIEEERKRMQGLQ